MSRITAAMAHINYLLNPLAVALRLLPGRGRVLMLAVAALMTLALVLVFNSSLQLFEERVGAQGWMLSNDRSVEERITIVAIDEQSLAEVGPWPWPRETMAELVTAIDQAGAQLQLHDVVYPEAREGDQALLAALESTRGAVIAQVPVLQSDQAVRTGVMAFPLTGLDCSASDLPATGSFVASNPTFANVARGHIAPWVARDGFIRRVPAVVCVDGHPYPALAISALLQAISADSWSVSLQPGNGWMQPEQVLRLDAYPGLNIPVDSAGMLRVSYRENPENFRAVSAADVLAGRIDPSLLENTWVLVGATAFGMSDIVPTIYSGTTPGVEIQARLLASLLDANMPLTPQIALPYSILLMLAFAAICLALTRQGDRVVAYGLPVAAVVLPLLALGLHWYLLATRELWMGWLTPAIYSVLAASMLLLLEQRRIRAERERVFDNLHSYLPADTAREIAYSLPSSRIDARRCDVTLLSADLRNFAAFGEARPPEESAALLHFFFVRANDIVERHGGHIHEFKGDGLLAVWDGPYQEVAHQALAAAQDMQREIQRDMPQQPPAGLEPLALGIGIEQGPALVGSIGPAHRRTHTLLGDTVTIALRIQEMTAELAQPILLGECIARQLTDVELESQGSYLLSGLRIPHVLFAPRIDDAGHTGQRDTHQDDKPLLKLVTGGRR